jgi:hypothetical protein
VDAAAGLGVVTYANSTALKLLGYAGSKREIMGKEMSGLIPAPIAAIHPRYLSGFVSGSIRLLPTSRSPPCDAGSTAVPAR